MNYEIKVIDCKAVGLEQALNQPASEGWQLVSCWPDGPNVRAVFQREARTEANRPAPLPVAAARSAAPVSAPTPAPPRSAPPTPIPADDKFLDAVINVCEPPKNKDGEPIPNLPPGINLNKLGKQWGVSAVQVRSKLQALGVKVKEGPKSKDHYHNGFFIWLNGNFVNIRAAKKKSPART